MTTHTPTFTAPDSIAEEVDGLLRNAQQNLLAQLVDWAEGADDHSVFAAFEDTDINALITFACVHGRTALGRALGARWRDDVDDPQALRRETLEATDGMPGDEDHVDDAEGALLTCIYAWSLRDSTIMAGWTFDEVEKFAAFALAFGEPDTARDIILRWRELHPDEYDARDDEFEVWYDFWAGLA